MQRNEHKIRIDGVEIVSTEEELWFLQNERLRWISKQDAWQSMSKIAHALKRHGFQVDVYHFPRKLREFVLNEARTIQG